MAPNRSIRGCAIQILFAMVYEFCLVGRMKTKTRVTGIGGVFFKAKNPAKLGDW